MFQPEHIINKKEVLKNLKDYKDKDYVAWIGHATFLIKLGDTTIITDPVFEKNMGPLNLWSQNDLLIQQLILKRYLK